MNLILELHQGSIATIVIETGKIAFLCINYCLIVINPKIAIQPEKPSIF